MSLRPLSTLFMVGPRWLMTTLLARATGNEFEFAVTFGFKQHLRTEGAVLVASRLAVVDLHFHGLILPDFRHQRKQH